MATSKAKDLADFIAKQSTDDDSILETGAMQLPAGTTGERPTPVAGMIRYNSTIGKAEQYDGTQWQAIDSPPAIVSVSPDNFDTAGDSITITGSNFSSDCTVTFINNSGSSFAAATLTRTNSSSLDVTVSSSMVSDDDDPYDVRVTNGSGLSATLENALDFAPEPVFATASGTLGTIYDSIRDSYSLSAVTATSTESDATLTYALGSGDSLPAGLSLNTSTGAITGTATAVGSNTTTTFDIVATATDGDSNVTTNTRSFSITVNAPVIQSFTSVGSGTFSVPTGITAVDTLVVAGGGGGAQRHGGGGGAGGLIYRPAFPVTPGGSVSYSVGRGGYGGQQPPYTPSAGGEKGYDSTFGTLTAKGGGGSGGDGTPPTCVGGSGGGADSRPGQEGAQTGNQPQQPGESGQSQYGFGNPSGTSLSPGGPTTDYGAGGGGAGGPGGNNSPSGVGAGGSGKTYSISGSSITYAEGGSGAAREAVAGPQNPLGIAFGTDATANRGSGGHGSHGTGNVDGGNGGSGIVIVKY